MTTTGRQTLLKKETMSAYEVKKLLGFEVGEGDEGMSGSSAKKNLEKSDSEETTADKKSF